MALIVFNWIGNRF